MAERGRSREVFNPLTPLLVALKTVRGGFCACAISPIPCRPRARKPNSTKTSVMPHTRAAPVVDSDRGVSWTQRALGPAQIPVEIVYGLPLPTPGADQNVLLGMWKFEREVGSMDEFYKAVGIPWSQRKMLLTVNPDIEWTTDQDGSTEMGFQPGQKGQLVRRSLHRGSQIGAPEAFPLGEFSPANDGSYRPQRIVITFKNGRLERRTINEWLPAGCICVRWQADEHQLVEIGCLGHEEKFYFARVYERVELSV
mmetsp:Transcript_59516/g.156834  ORF Transcript_59516/g.156834 Transcript_59516/m.156834 type:complete len:254 (+) Transcript_59516:82-843(+)